MRSSQQSIEAILQLAQGLPGLTHAALPQAAAAATAIEAELSAGAQAWLSQPPSADATDCGIQLAQAAIEAGPAVRALATAQQWCARAPAPEVLGRVVGMHVLLAQSSLLRALRPLAKVPPGGNWPEPVPGGSTTPAPAARERPPLAGAPSPSEMDLGVLRNIATYHREHERFYTLDITESAVDLYREANKLRIVAGVWLGAQAQTLPHNVDFGLPQYQAAGCVDLNAVAAIAAIGVLFMEGEAEPSEIRVMKGKLQALAGAWSRVGQWLADKMDAAWEREQATCTPALAGVMQARFNTITTNWRGAREMSLTGQLLATVVASLNAIDFNPRVLRHNRQGAGRRLLETAWMLSQAAQIRARSAADLAENDRNWTAYLDGLPPTE